MNLLKKMLIKNGYIDYNEIIEKFKIYYALLIKENEKYNLTAITEKKQVETKHFIDSIQTLNKIKGEIIDIGTGAGFPSIPLAIIKKEENFLLVDSLKKRTDFLELVKKELELKNVKILHKRVEDIEKNIKYDIALTRAVAPLNIICEYSLPFVKIGGVMLAYKGDNFKEEINNAKNALSVLGGKIKDVYEYELKNEEQIYKRSIIEIEKIKESPSIYPRGANKPRSKSL